ncbi:MAG: acyl carrier protein [Pseudomonadota bacterium]|nr:acyl carrier protein [Pseudomonadota bacterium]
MTQQEILAQLNVIFCQVFNDDTLVLTPASTAADIEEWDSFNHINIIVAAEAHFKIRFKSAETEALRNVGDFIELIDAKVKAR